MKKITVAITTFNRFGFVLECLQHVLDDPRVDEIVISDDASTDGSYDKLVEYYAPFPKVKLFQNHENVDCYANKAAAVGRASNDWVILFDSDNILRSDYIDALYALGTWSKDVAYLPSFARPHFDYRTFQGVVITKENVAHHVKFYRNLLTAFNTANYFFYREAYLEVWDSWVNPHTVDSMYQNYRWLASGRKLLVVPGMEYFHRIHAESHYKLNVHKTGNFAREVEDKIKALR